MDRKPPQSNQNQAGNALERRGSHLADAQVIAPQQASRQSPVVARNMMRRQADRGFSLGTVLALMVRRRWTVATVFSLLFLPVLGYVLTREAKYEAELKLILKRTAAPGVAVVGGAAGVSEGDAQAEIEMLKSRTLYEEASRRAGLIAAKATPKEVALAVAALEQSLKVTQIGKTNIISVKYHSTKPEAAAEIPNALAELYLRKHIELHSNDEAARFFTDQTAIYQKQLEAAQTALTRFRQTGDVSLLLDQKQAYLRRATDLEAAMQEAESGLRDAEQRVTILARQREQQPSTVETGSRIARTSPTSEKLKALLIDLGNKRTELLTKYDPSYRLVKEVDREIADAQVSLERESAPRVVDQTNAPNPLRQSLEGDLLRTQSQMAGLRARRSTLSRDLAEYRGRQRKLESATADHNDLERAVKIAEENFMLYQRKLEEARLAEALDKQRLLSVAILEKATVPALAASQHRTSLLLFGLLAAAFLSLASAFVSDYLERHLPTRASLEEQVLAEPPAAPDPAAAERRVAPPVMENLALAATPEPVLQVSGVPTQPVGPRNATYAQPARPQQVTYPPPARPQPISVLPQPAPIEAEAAATNARREAPQRPLPVGPQIVEPISRRRPAMETQPSSVTSSVTTSVTVTHEEVDPTGNVTTTAVVLRKADAWRELFDRRSRGAALVRQKQTSNKDNKIDPDFLKRIQDKKTPSRDHRTGTRG